MTFNERSFRDALGAFATGVAIVTATTETGKRLGITVSSFNAASLSPPLVLFSVARRSHSVGDWGKIKRYAINVLSQQQEELSNRFARAGDDKWSGTLVLDGERGPPILPNALAVFQCEPYARYDGGDHEIFVGRVIALRTTPHRLDLPLIFFGGRYRRIDANFGDLPPPNISIFEGW